MTCPASAAKVIVEKGIKKYCSYTCKGADCLFICIFKYLKDAGLCEHEPENDAIVFNLDGKERCFVVWEYGYFIYHDIWASEEMHHTFESEAEAANDIINEKLNPIQIYRIEDGEEHGMRFSWFFDEFPADNAEEFIRKLKAKPSDSHVHFLPWVGKNYSHGIYGRKVLFSIISSRRP